MLNEKNHELFPSMQSLNDIAKHVILPCNTVYSDHTFVQEVKTISALKKEK